MKHCDSQRRVTLVAVNVFGMLLFSCGFSLLSDVNAQSGIQPRPAITRPPNIVLILADDLGYGDLSCYGSKTINTPNIDALARSGTRFTSFYVSQAVCSASRASLMTGCYANRVGMEGALNHVSRQGIHPREYLLSELLKDHGYATGVFGKWHLGLPPAFSPLKNGFDDFFGIPYSNDNSKFHPSLASEMPPLPLYDGDTIVETDPDQSLFTQRIAQRSVDFIAKNTGQPFFLYVPIVMPHVPIFASKTFQGRSGNGLYADVVEEMDWAVGKIVKAVDDSGLREHTLILFASDNGPFLSYGNHAGSTGGLREGKLTAYEGGVRVPCIMRWPGFIPSNQESKAPIMTIDLLPTIAAWLGHRDLPNRVDGLDVSSCLFGQTDQRPSNAPLLFYSGTELHAIRVGNWKLHLPHAFIAVDGKPGEDGKPAKYGQLQPKSISQSGIAGIASRHGYVVKQQALALYNLTVDLFELEDVSGANSEIVDKMLEIATQSRRALGDSILGIPGTEVRPCGTF